MDLWTTDSRTFRTFLLVSQIDPAGIRARIKQARKEAGLRQEDLAELLEVHKRTVENYENVRVPEWRTLNRIARILDRPLEWFLHGDQAPADGVEAALDELREELRRRHQELVERLDAIAQAQRDLAARLSERVR